MLRLCCPCCYAPTASVTLPQAEERRAQTTTVYDRHSSDYLQPESLISYNKLNDLESGESISFGVYEASYAPFYKGYKYFTHFFYKGETHHAEKKIREQQKGWKIHISISTQDCANLSKGVEIVNEILIRYNVYHWKLIRSDALKKMRDDNEEGKTVTIYAFQEDRSSESWGIIFQEIENELARAKVEPGPVPLDHDRNSVAENNILGSKYIYYRNDDIVGAGPIPFDVTEVQSKSQRASVKFSGEGIKA